MSAASLTLRSPGIAPSETVAARLREPSKAEFQSHLIPPAEHLAWQRPAAPVHSVRPDPGPGAPQSPSAPSTIELARIADDVYNDVPAPPPGYRVASSSDLARIGLSTRDLSSSQSAFRARVYVRGEGSETQYVVAFRGTADRGDWTANARQAAGLSSDHYTRALMIAKAIGRNPGAEVTLTGHSLGGGLASAAALASGRNAATFNAAGLSDVTVRQAQAIRAGDQAPRIAAFYVRGEVLSAVQDGGDRVLGGLFGGPFGSRLDAPEAYGTRIPLDAIAPKGTGWFGDNAVARHGMDWVLSSLGAN